MYLGHASTAAGVTRDLLERELTVPSRGRTGRPTRTPERRPDDVAHRDEHGRPLPSREVARGARGARPRVAGERAIGAERELTRVLLHRPAYFEQVVERMGAESFRDPELRRIFAAMVEHGPDVGAEVLAGALDGDAVVVMQELLEESGGLDHADETVAGSLAALHERDLARRLEEIDRLMPLADTTEKDVLTREKMQLRDELRRLGSRRFKGFSPQR
jgi:hypothetical protein